MNIVMSNKKFDRTNDVSFVARELLKRNIVNEVKIVYFGNFDINGNPLVAKIVKEDNYKTTLFLNETNSYEDMLFVLKAILREYETKKTRLDNIIKSSTTKRPVSIRMKPNLTRQLIVTNAL